MSALRRAPRGALRRLAREERGATAVVVAIFSALALVAAALVIDVGAGQARRAQLQDAADAAALALGARCLDAPDSSTLACGSSVQGIAHDVAEELATRTVLDGVATVRAVAFAGREVTVELESPQSAFFGVVAGEDELGVAVSATAEWGPRAFPLPLAMASCAFPDEPSDTQTTVLHASLAIGGLLGTVADLLDALLSPGEDCGGLLTGLSTTVGVVSGGWLTTSESVLGLTPNDCSYDPNLLTTVSGTVSKLVPSQCADVVASWSVSPMSPRRVVIPVFDNGIEQLLVDDVFGFETVDRYAVFDVTGYSFSGLLGIGTAPGGDDGLCATNDILGEILGGTLDVVHQLLLALLGGLDGLLNSVTGCQALEGHFQGFVDSEEAAQLAAAVRLID